MKWPRIKKTTVRYTNEGATVTNNDSSPCSEDECTTYSVCPVDSRVTSNVNNIIQVDTDEKTSGKKTTITPRQLSPTISNVLTSSILSGDSFSYSLRLSSGAYPVKWYLLDGPNGIHVYTYSGEVYWSNPPVGSHRITVAVTNYYGYDQTSFYIHVSSAVIIPVIESIDNDSASVGSPYSLTPTLSQGTTPVVWSLTTYPDGMVIDSLTGEITWDSPTEGDHSITVRATNDAGYDEESYVLLVAEYAEMSAASRTSGTAPLVIFFDVVGEGSGVVQPGGDDYASLHYEWNFGDVGAENWDTSNQSKNIDEGYTAAHVYETAGNYDVTLSVLDPSTNDVWNYTQSITVSNFSGTTYYVSSSEGDDGNDGLSEEEPLETFEEALNQVGTNTRILFKRGDSWTISVGDTLSASGPGILGAYGEGASPIITNTGVGSVLAFGGEDWRIMDITLIGPGETSTTAGILGVADGVWENCLVLRCDISYFRTGVEVGGISGKKMYNAIVECNIHDIWINGIFMAGEPMAVLGTLVDDVYSSHACRVWQFRKSVFNHNIIQYPGGNRPCLKLHGPLHDDPIYSETKYSVICYNEFIGRLTDGGEYQDLVTFEPENASSDQRVSDLVFERNWIRSGTLTDGMVTIHARRVTIRNNVFVATGATRYPEAVIVSQRGIEPAPEDNHIYNNTVYSGSDCLWFFGVRVGSSASGTIIRNNLVSAPAATSYTFIEDLGSGTVESNNLFTDTPGFVNAESDNFHLQSGSSARDSGYDVGLPYDYLRNARVGNTDIGAYEYQV